MSTQEGSRAPLTHPTTAVPVEVLARPTRLHREILSIAWATAATVGWLVLSLEAIRRFLPAAAWVPARARPIIAMAVFAACAFIVLPLRHFLIPASVTLGRGLLVEGLMLCALYAGVAFALSGSPATVFSAASAAIVSFAVVEEMVFRIALPSYFTALFSTAKVARAGAFLCAQIVSQATFALAHMGPLQLIVPHGPTEILRLGAAGLLYAAVTRVTGLWLAAAMHAALNFDAMLMVAFQPSDYEWFELALTAALGAYVLAKSARAAAGTGVPSVPPWV